jgi:predicted O-methyltransferase YrrM
MNPENYKRISEVATIKKVVKSYNAQGFEVGLGNPDCLLTRLSRKGRIVNASAAISISDIQVFQWIADTSPWGRSLVIGNSFGFSTFIIAGLCPGCYVDVIDAEVEGSENRLGSELTRKIAERDFPGVHLTIGFSPNDLPNACRFNNYDFIFIDGLHTNDQLVADFNGIRDLRAENSLVYCHDVGIAKMHEGWSRICSELLEEGDEAFDLHFTSFGSTIVVRGNPALKEVMRLICRPLNEVYYYFGARHIGLRSAFRMLLRTLIYSTRYGNYIRRLREKIED